MVQPSFQPKSIFKILLVHHYVFIKVSFSPDSPPKKKKFLSRQDFKTWPEPKMQYVNLCKGHMRPNLYGIIHLKYGCGLRDTLVEVLDWAPWGTCIGLHALLRFFFFDILSSLNKVTPQSTQFCRMGFVLETDWVNMAQRLLDLFSLINMSMFFYFHVKTKPTILNTPSSSAIT